MARNAGHPKTEFGDCSKVVAGNVRLIREKQGLTQAALADRLGWSMMAVWRLESGRVAPKVDQLCELAAALDVPWARLLKASSRG